MVVVVKKDRVIIMKSLVVLLVIDFALLDLSGCFRFLYDEMLYYFVSV